MELFRKELAGLYGYLSQPTPHESTPLSKNTNKRLERCFGKVKADLHRSMSIKDCLESVIRYQRRREDEYVTRVLKPRTPHNINFDDEMNKLLGLTSDWVTDIFMPEYNFAVDIDAFGRYVVEDGELYVVMRRVAALVVLTSSTGRVHANFRKPCSCRAATP